MRYKSSGSCAALLVTIAISASASAQTETVLLKIRVLKQAWNATTQQPFPGIGVFELMRGNDKLSGANCPDHSGSNGEVLCRVPCKRTDELPMTVRVRPPADQDKLAGWVIPPAQDVRVQRCTVSPEQVTMRYDDARYALNDMAAQYLAQAGGTPAAGAAWAVLAERAPDSAARLAADMARSAEGRAVLAAMAELPGPQQSGGAGLPLFGIVGKPDAGAMALERWQVLSKSALLQSRVDELLPQTQRAGLDLAPTTELGRYKANLGAAERAVFQIEKKNTEQARLADDIKWLREASADSKNTARGDMVMKNWKSDAARAAVNR